MDSRRLGKFALEGASGGEPTYRANYGIRGSWCVPCGNFFFWIMQNAAHFAIFSYLLGLGWGMAPLPPPPLKPPMPGGLWISKFCVLMFITLALRRPVDSHIWRTDVSRIHMQPHRGPSTREGYALSNINFFLCNMTKLHYLPPIVSIEYIVSIVGLGALEAVSSKCCF